MSFTNQAFTLHNPTGARVKQVILWTILIIPALAFWLSVIPRYAYYIAHPNINDFAYQDYTMPNLILTVGLVLEIVYLFIWVRMNYKATEREVVREITIYHEPPTEQPTLPSEAWLDSYDPSAKELSSVRTLEDLTPAQWLQRLHTRAPRNVAACAQLLKSIPKDDAWTKVRTRLLTLRKSLAEQDRARAIDKQFPQAAGLKEVKPWDDACPSPTVTLSP